MKTLKIIVLGLFDAFRIQLKFLAIVLLLFSLLANFSLAAANFISGLAASVGVATVTSRLLETNYETKKKLTASEKRSKKAAAALATERKAANLAKQRANKAQLALGVSQGKTKQAQVALSSERKASNLAKQNAEKAMIALIAAQEKTKKAEDALVTERKASNLAKQKNIKLAKDAQLSLFRATKSNIGSLAGEVVPYVGAAVAIGATAYEVKQACEMSNYLAEITGEKADACGLNLPEWAKDYTDKTLKCGWQDWKYSCRPKTEAELREKQCVDRGWQDWQLVCKQWE